MAYWLGVGAEGIPVVQFDTEERGKAATGMRPPVRNLEAGQAVFARAPSLTAALDATPPAAVYGLGD